MFLKINEAESHRQGNLHTPGSLSYNQNGDELVAQNAMVNSILSHPNCLNEEDDERERGRGRNHPKSPTLTSNPITINYLFSLTSFNQNINAEPWAGFSIVSLVHLFL